MAFVFTWLRLSSMRQLDWCRNSNAQSKDIAAVQRNLTQRMAAKAALSKDPLCRLGSETLRSLLTDALLTCFTAKE